MLPLQEPVKTGDKNRRVKVLLADDEPAVQQTIKRRLVAIGYEVIIANNGEEALWLARQENPDVIVMDIMMPKMNGDMVAAELKSDQRTIDIPIIFLTCLIQPDEALTPQHTVGNNLMLAKPLDSVRLVAMIEKVVGR